MEYRLCWKCKGLSSSSRITSNQMESHSRQCPGEDVENIEMSSFDYFLCNKADFFALLEIKKSLNKDVCIRLKNRDSATDTNVPNNVIESLLKLSISKNVDTPKQQILNSSARSTLTQRLFTADQCITDSDITKCNPLESSKSTVPSSLPSPSSCEVRRPFTILTEEETAKLNEYSVSIKLGNFEKFECKLCKYQTKSSKIMLRHLNSHNNGKAFECEHCGFSTTMRVKWNDHHCKYQAGKLLCHLCPERFNSQSKLDHHLAVLHSEEVTNQATQHLQCNSCDYIARYPGSLKEHQRKHTGESLTCHHDNCNFKSLYNRSLQKHLQQKHSKEKNQICDICGFQTRHSSSLKKHMQLHRDSKQCYKCAECSFSDSRPSQLLLHVQRKHLKVKNLSCSKCPFKTSYQEAMRKHMARHERIEADEARGIKSSKTRKLKYYFCSVCGEVLNNMKAAKEHIQKFHSTEEFQIVSDGAISKAENGKRKDQSVSTPTAFSDKTMNFDNLLDVDISNDVLDIASNILSNEVSEKDTYAPDNVAMSITDEPMCQDVFHNEEANSSVSTKGGNPMLSATNDVLTDIDSTLIEDSLFDLMSDFPPPPTLNRCQSASTLMFASLTQHMVDRPLTPDFFTDSPAQSFFQNFSSRSMDQDNFTVSSLNQPFQMSAGFPSQMDLTMPARANKPPSPVLANFTCFPTNPAVAQTSLNLESSVDTETAMAECLLQSDSMNSI